MYRKIQSQISSENPDTGNLPASTSQETKRYVLEEVFWVPAHNCGPADSSCDRSPEVREENADSGEAPNFRTSN
jgi:hypothetical protein